jgi:hypothetical protein
MFLLLLADGITSSAGERLAAFTVKCLAVGGGFLVGYFIGTAAAWALDRWVLAHKSPPQLKKIVSILAGLALSIVVALIVFGEGGNGLFGGGGSQGAGTGAASSESTTTTPPIAPTIAPKIEEQPKKDAPPRPLPALPTAGDIRIRILSGDEVHDGKFYLIDGEDAAKTLEELSSTTAARRAASKTELTLIFRFKNEPLSDNHPAIRSLDAWLKDAKLNNRRE